jgi:creatinine amidohydrolase/Fe(II)-dependent formamide hydrolase-like protein
MDHAGAWETSCMLYAYPHRVDLDTLRQRELSSDEDFEMRGPEGIGGKNPLKYASAEMGRRIVERMGDLIGAKAVQML